MVHRADNLSNLDLRGEPEAWQVPMDSVGDVDGSTAGVPLEIAARRTSFWMAIPAWFVSMLVHVALILFMAAYHIEEIAQSISAYVVNATPVDATEEIENFAIEEAMEIEIPQASEEPTPQAAPMTQEVAEIPMDVAIDNIWRASIYQVSPMICSAIALARPIP
jgi:hypothetical protein